MKNYKAVIFDLDGTLANTIPDLSTAMNEMLTLNSLPNRNIDQLLLAINYGAREFVRRSLPEEYQDNDAFIDASENAVMQIKLDETHLWEVGNGQLYDLEITFGEDLRPSRLPDPCTGPG